MKIFNGKQIKLRAIAMTEYLIILAIVAIAAIAIVGIFGQQIKDVFSRNTQTLGGQDSGGGKGTDISKKGTAEAGKTDNMSDFDKAKNTPGQ